MRVVDFLNELSQHSGDAEVITLEWDDDGVYCEVKKPSKSKPKKADSNNSEE